MAYWSVFRRSVEHLSHATDHEHSSFAIADETLVGIVLLEHFRNGNEQSVSPCPMAFSRRDTLPDHRCHQTIAAVSSLVWLVD